jgi:hypothetical protein
MQVALRGEHRRLIAAIASARFSASPASASAQLVSVELRPTSTSTFCGLVATIDW